MSVLAALAELVERRTPVALATVIEGPDAGAEAVFGADGSRLAGELPPGLEEPAGADAAALIGRGRHATVRYGDRRVFHEVVAPPPRLLVYGAGEIARHLCPMAAAAGFEVIIADQRPRFATVERFPAAARVEVGWPEEIMDRWPPDEHTYVATLAHNARFEDPVLGAALRAPVAYAGALGSRGTHADRLERLHAAGLTAEQTGRLHAPIGLDIGAATPVEIAVAILAELIRVRRAAPPARIAGIEGPPHP